MLAGSLQPTSARGVSSRRPDLCNSPQTWRGSPLQQRCFQRAAPSIRKAGHTYLRTCCAANNGNGAGGLTTGGHEKAGQEAKAARNWNRSIIVENRAESADGTLRTLVLSVEDHVTFLDGRKMHRRQEGPRWIDAYKVPGQFVGIRYPPDPVSDSTSASVSGSQEDAAVGPASGSSGGSSEEADAEGEPPTARTLFAIASSPYNARRDSANLDASIIEILVDRGGCEDNRRLAALGPGALIEVSEVLGRGFASLFNSYVGLLSGMEDARNLLLVGAGCRGIAPLRAALEWTPVQAHATAHRISLVYVAPSALSAAYLKDWDSWRETGIHVSTVYLNDNGNGNGASAADLHSSPAVWEAVRQAVFERPQGLMGAVGGDPRDCTVLVSGLPGEAAAQLTKRLSAEGVSGERVLFCDFF